MLQLRSLSIELLGERVELPGELFDLLVAGTRCALLLCVSLAVIAVFAPLRGGPLAASVRSTPKVREVRRRGRHELQAELVGSGVR